MGAMQCERRDCTQVCCAHIVDSRYICSDCLAEFRNMNANEPTLAPGEWRERFSAFMATAKGYYVPSVTLDDFIRRY